MDSTANTWLAILAIATVVETMVLVGVLVTCAVAVRRMSNQINRLQKDHIEPLVARVGAMADNVQDGLSRLRSADDEIRRVVAKGATGAADAVKAAKNSVWPALGVLRGATAAVSFLARRLPRDLTERPRLPAVVRHPEGARHVRQ